MMHQATPCPTNQTPFERIVIMRTDRELSLALALAVGWVEADTYPLPRELNPEFLWVMRDDRVWCVFDYRDWNVIGPIAERYFAFPAQYVDSDGKVVAWEANLYSERTGRWHNLVKADSPQKAIALSVVGAHRNGQLPDSSPLSN
jgi:hypothetical protein